MSGRLRRKIGTVCSPRRSSVGPAPNTGCMNVPTLAAMTDEGRKNCPSVAHVPSPSPSKERPREPCAVVLPGGQVRRKIERDDATKMWAAAARVYTRFGETGKGS